MGGGAGVVPIDDIIRICDKLAINLQIIAMAGNNKAMLQKLQNIKSKHVCMCWDMWTMS